MLLTIIAFSTYFMQQNTIKNIGFTPYQPIYNRLVTYHQDHT